jgi:prepilin-type processing-associated H-X9-DG protein
MSNPPHRSNLGFTLVELLASVGIVVGLIALLLPAYRSTVDRAGTARCAANLRSVGQSFLTYAADNDGTLPFASVYIGQSQVTWWSLLKPYLGENALTSRPSPLICPETYKAARKEPNSKIPWWANYGMNAHMGQNWPSTAPSGAKKLAQIQNPSRKILAGDGDWNTGSPLCLLEMSKPDAHAGGRNILFCDGHVEWWKNSKQLKQSPYAYGSTQDMWRP